MTDNRIGELKKFVGNEMDRILHDNSENRDSLMGYLVRTYMEKF